jgi:hypothetical protein
MNATQLRETIKNLKASGQRFTFTLEAGRGETYATQEPTLYGHSRYPRGSVLAGKPLRRWIASWKTWQEAANVLYEAKVRYTTEGGTSHIPVNELTAHLPGESL